MPVVVSTSSELSESLSASRRRGNRIGLVPTMGALHEGHLSLVDRAVAETDFVIVTIFVNPSQFGPNEDLAKYPQTLDDDLRALDGRAAVVFVPSVEIMYPAGFSTYVAPPDVARRWEGECRPDHFRGVATVVLKLFMLCPADVAFFGEKDFQQAMVIRRMVDDLNVPMQIETCPTVREEGGLAMSSRNRYLLPEERLAALSICSSLAFAKDAILDGETNAERLVTKMKRRMMEAGVDSIDYVVLVDPETLEPREVIDSPSQALVAVHVGGTRLIDNARVA